ncbi:hypothetical protein VTJ04DRAFT_3440 [Mycothermus thermophilus]|uniref:uncharacterized protein n=1 Tax=Humicola insolens TaxID=85995 RepID=UPI003742FE4C
MALAFIELPPPFLHRALHDAKITSKQQQAAIALVTISVLDGGLQALKLSSNRVQAGLGISAPCVRKSGLSQALSSRE